jgi:hypothetical protein
MNTATAIEDDDEPILKKVVEPPPRVEVALSDQPTPIPDDPRDNQERTLLARYVRDEGDFTEFVEIRGLKHIGLELVRFRSGRRTFLMKLWHGEYVALAAVLPELVERARTLMVMKPKTNLQYRPNHSAAPLHRPGVPRGTTSPK